jgi:hypothetical protein
MCHPPPGRNLHMFLYGFLTKLKPVFCTICVDAKVCIPWRLVTVTDKSFEFPHSLHLSHHPSQQCGQKSIHCVHTIIPHVHLEPSPSMIPA